MGPPAIPVSWSRRSPSSHSRVASQSPKADALTKKGFFSLSTISLSTEITIELNLELGLLPNGQFIQLLQSIASLPAGQPQLPCKGMISGSCR
jgi:hypothetical protein